MVAGEGVFGFGGIVGFFLACAHALYALFYFAHAGQVFIQLAFLAGAYTLGKILVAIF
jgi:hypothetical protein